ncbi:MAG: hypothetical protein EBT97_01830 [Actinobacteria bacterium]|nr:hypothetical protein [Actinomycetota bacterium]
MSYCSGVTTSQTHGRPPVCTAGTCMPAHATGSPGIVTRFQVTGHDRRENDSRISSTSCTLSIVACGGTAMVDTHVGDAR